MSQMAGFSFKSRVCLIAQSTLIPVFFSGNSGSKKRHGKKSSKKKKSKSHSFIPSSNNTQLTGLYEFE